MNTKCYKWKQKEERKMVGGGGGRGGKETPAK